MTSQSSAPGEAPTDAYREAWASMSALALNGGFSWSGNESNRAFLNLGGGRFADVSGLTGADWTTDGRACARLDWDGDGREDLVLRNRNAPRLRLMLNRWPRPGHWMQFDLAGTSCNRDAVGAQVLADADGRALRGAVRCGEGFLAASSKRVHLGLGEATEARVRVRWPGGATEDFGVLAADRRWRLVEGEGAARPVEQPTAASLLARPAAPAAAAELAVTRVPLLQALPAGPLPLPGWEQPARTIGDLAGKPALVNFWSTDCSACRAEFEMFQRRAPLLARSGLRIVPMLIAGDAGAPGARAILAGHGLAEHAGALDDRATALLAPLLGEALVASEEIPLPFSLLFDARGRLRVVYLGPIRFRELMQDAQALNALPLDALQEPQLCGGTVLIPRARNLDRLAARYEELEAPELAAFYRTEHETLLSLIRR